MDNPQAANISPHEVLARKFEDWQKQYMDQVNSHFLQEDEDRGRIAFQSWERRFLGFLEKEAPGLVSPYNSSINGPKAYVSYFGQSVHSSWENFKGSAIRAFITQAIEDARAGYLIAESESPGPTPVAVEAIVSNKVFIGHGRSNTWKELRDFLRDRLRLDWDEFNREPTAGFTTIDRLEEMLAEASFAFLVLTADDEHRDGSMHARENVVHETGLFQGKLGFRKAIVLLEEGCAEFSNIVGLTQLRFPKGNIGAISEEIRRVLEREGLLRK